MCSLRLPASPNRKVALRRIPHNPWPQLQASAEPGVIGVKVPIVAYRISSNWMSLVSKILSNILYIVLVCFVCCFLFSSFKGRKLPFL